MKISRNKQNQFIEILKKEKIYPVYQPIISLKDGSIYGYEALSRINIENCTFTTEDMFRIAEKMHCLWKLESICRKKAIKKARKIPKGKKLFLNVDPNIINDKEFRSGVTAAFLKKYGLNPNDIVFEIIERNTIKNPKTFYRTIKHYSKQNYKIAIDDFGAEYAGPNRLCMLKPDIIKVDISIIEDIDKDSFKKCFMQSMAIFGRNTGTKILAEGIENSQQLKTLISLGIDYGQGFYLGKPSYSFSKENQKITREIKDINANMTKMQGQAVTDYINKHSSDKLLYILDENGQLIEKFTCNEFKHIWNYNKK